MKNTIQGYWRAVCSSKFSISRLSQTHLGADRVAVKVARNTSLGFITWKCHVTVIGALLCVTSHAATNPHWEFAVPKVFENGKKWFCQTEVRDNEWYMRCDDLAAILSEDPVLKNNVVFPAPKLIPLYGAPYADSPLPLLAKSVLCGRDLTCNVVVAAW